jgi:hypothetical protein
VLCYCYGLNYTIHFTYKYETIPFQKKKKTVEGYVIAILRNMHLFLHCNFASQCWNLLGISITQAPQFCFYPQDEVAVAVFHGGGHSHVLVNLEFKK